jgi:hypothetical protein
MVSDVRFLAAVLCGLTACSPQVLHPPRAHVGPPEPPPITDREIVGTWVGTTVCRGIATQPAMGLHLTIELDYVSVDSCKTHVCEHTMVTGLFERSVIGDAGGTVPETVKLQGMLAGRGVSFYRFDRASGQSVHVLNGDVSIDGATFSGGVDDCGEFSLRKKT